MNCDVCGKNIDSAVFFTCAEVKGSSLCQNCFESVTTIVAKGAARAESRVVETATSSHEDSQVAQRCQCGSYEDSQSICTGCEIELERLPGSADPEKRSFGKPPPGISPMEIFLSTLGKILFWALWIAGLLVLVFFIVCSGILMSTKF